MQNCLLQLRQEKGLTQEELATKLGVTRQTVISIEKGKYIPSLPLAIKMAKLFKQNVEDMFWEIKNK